MRRHVVIGRMGEDDKTTFEAAPNEVTTELPLGGNARQLAFGIGQAAKDLAGLGLHPTNVGIDLLVLAAHVHAADTRISRKTESQDTWTREIRLVVPVEDPALWEAAAPLLARLLHFLTGDRWALEFRLRPDCFVAFDPSEAERGDPPSLDDPCLFSGGLDSLIGAIDILEQGKNPVLISHAGEASSSDAQNACFDELSAHYDDRALRRLRVWMNFPTDLVQDVETESTTRGRSFLFVALGIFAGIGLARPFTLAIPENGLIALNVPLDLVRLGALSTRTTHPFYLARWNEVLGMLGVRARVENPYWNRTKGEMVSQCSAPELLRSLLRRTLSCASPAKARWQGHGSEHCGYCLPCLIRRAAIETALGASNDPTSYTIADLASQELDTGKAEGQQVRSFQVAIERLRADPRLADLLIHVPGSLAENETSLDALAGVYRRGMEEIAELLNSVRAGPS